MTPTSESFPTEGQRRRTSPRRSFTPSPATLRSTGSSGGAFPPSDGEAANLDTAVASSTPGVAQEVMMRQELDLLQQAVAELPAGCRSVLLLRNLEQLSHKEIAARLDIAVSTVEKQHARALRLLRTALARRIGAAPAGGPCRNGRPTHEHIQPRSEPSPSAADQAALWAARCDGSDLSATDRLALQDWLAAHPAHPTLLAEYREVSSVLKRHLPALAARGTMASPRPLAPARSRRNGWLVRGRRWPAAAAAMLSPSGSAARPASSKR